MIGDSVLDEFQESVLNDIRENPLNDQSFGLGIYQTHARLHVNFDDDKSLDEALQYLEQGKYIKEVRYDRGNEVHLRGYKLTPRGSNYLRQSKADHSQKFSNINGSNISVGSNQVKQSITKPETHSSPTGKKDHKWFWWLMSIIGGLIVLLVGAYLFGVGK